MNDGPHKLRIIIESDGEGGYMADAPEVPGFLAWGQTMDRLMQGVDEVARMFIEVYREDGRTLPDGLQNYADAGDDACVEILSPAEAASGVASGVA